MLYPVNEIFSSLQGEGRWAGRQMAFIRLAGCNLNCPWCDTNYAERAVMTVEEIITRLRLLPEIKADDTNNNIPVVLTGGEPTIHDLQPLVTRLRSFSKKIHLETNGVGTGVDRQWLRQNIDWITLSPKHEHRPIEGFQCDEIKIVLDGLVCPQDYFAASFDSGGGHLNFFVQPVWGDPVSLRRCIDFVKENPSCRLSLQLHKYLNIS